MEKFFLLQQKVSSSSKINMVGGFIIGFEYFDFSSFMGFKVWDVCLPKELRKCSTVGT